MKYKRGLAAPRQAFFLFGPRGTGKSTWVKQNLSPSLLIDLLSSATYLEHLKDPSLLKKEVLACSHDTWIIIDEIQKITPLLNEVQDLMENHGYKRFALTGSSARKLRRRGGNLLAGRAVLKQLFPLTFAELNFSISIEQSLNYGSLPASVNAVSNEERVDFLTSYVETYLREEIREEGLVRRLESFARFLDVASLAAAQVTNLQSLARDSGVGRNSVRSFFSILEDTLMGRWLPAYRPRAKVKEIAHPKFFWFDTGVLRAAAGGFRQPLPSDWQGRMLETWLFHELSAHIHYHSCGGELSYWRTPSGSEVDFIWQKGSAIVAIEAKAAKSYQSKFTTGIKALGENLKIKDRFIVYLGDKTLKDGNIHIIPAASFAKMLSKGDVIGC